MMRINRVRQDWRDAGPVNRLIGHGFIDRRTFLTKSGELGIVFALTGVDGDCLDHPERDQVARRFQAVLRGLDERFRLQQYFLKQGGV